jgi:hypothetical protein
MGPGPLVDQGGIKSGSETGATQECDAVGAALAPLQGRRVRAPKRPRGECGV